MPLIEIDLAPILFFHKYSPIEEFERNLRLSKRTFINAHTLKAPKLNSTPSNGVTRGLFYPLKISHTKWRASFGGDPKPF